jgi:hypothetical protein
VNEKRRIATVGYFQNRYPGPHRAVVFPELRFSVVLIATNPRLGAVAQFKNYAKKLDR